MLKKSNMVTTAGFKQPSKTNSDVMLTLPSMTPLPPPLTHTNKQLTTTLHKKVLAAVLKWIQNWFLRILVLNQAK